LLRVVILGGGHVGSLIARRLLNEGSEVTIVELSEERCAELESTLDAKVIRGSAVSIETLNRAGISEADMLIAVTESDEANILGCLIAQCNSNVKFKLLRLRTHEVDLWRKVCSSELLRVDLVIHPDRETAERILKAIESPGISEIHDFADGRVKLFGMNIEGGSLLAGKSVEQLRTSTPALPFSVQ
jgi:trk system potassium uptake protein TrkA